MNPDKFTIDIKDIDGNTLIKAIPHDASGTNFSRSLSTPDQFILDTFSVRFLPDWKNKADLRLIYDQLDYRQQVWIYNALTNQLLFVGVIIQRPSDMNGRGIEGQDIRFVFTERRLGHYEIITGTLQTSLEYLSRLWQPVFLDELSSLANWTPFSGDWGITNGKMTATSGGTPDGVADNIIYHEYPVDPLPFRWQVTVSSASLLDNRIVGIGLAEAGMSADFRLDILHTPNEAGHLFTLNYNDLTETLQRFISNHLAPVDTLLTIDIWVLSGSIEIWLNGIQIIIVSSAHSYAGNYRFFFQAENLQTFEDAVRWTKQEYMALNLNTTKSSSSVDQEFSQDTYQGAFSFFFDTFQLESRADFLTSGIHELEVGDFVGEDKSNYIIFERGQNIKSLSSPSSSQQLATRVDLFGQGQFTNQTLHEAMNFPAIRTYGVIEAQVNDSRITVQDTARQKAKSILATRSSGKVSMTATLVETPATRGRWDAGDIIQVIDLAQAIDRPARVLKVVYNEAAPERQVTFDQLPFDQQANSSKQSDRIDDIYRNNKGDTANVTFLMPRRTLWVDCYLPEFRYTNDPSAVAGPPITKWQSISGGPGIGAYNGTLQFVNINASFVTLTFYSSSIKIFVRTDANMASMNIYLDGGLVASPSLNTGGQVDRVLIYDNGYALTSGLHILKMERTGAANLNLFINIDAVRLGGWYRDIFIEGRAVNSATITWVISDQTVNIRVIIDNIDRTEALGGPVPGFQGDQDVDALQFLSKPGAHSVEFVNDDSGIDDLYLEATITAVVLV